MHDATRRMVCRAGFFAICVIPTVGVFAFCFTRNSASHTRAYEQSFSADLGLIVKLSEVEHPRPGVLLLHDVELSEPEAQQPFFKARLLETAVQGGTVVVIASQPEIRGAQWPAVWEFLGRRLRRQMPASGLPVRFCASSLTVHSGEDVQTFSEVTGQVDTTGETESLTLNFRMVGVDMAETAKIRVARDRHASPPRTSIELNTGGGSLPCSVLCSPLTTDHRLGNKAKYRGYLSFHETAGGWQGFARGLLQDIDLTRLVTESFPHHLSGTAQILLRSLSIVDGRVEAAEGELNAGPGVISRSLWKAAQTHLEMQLNPDLETLLAKSGDLLQYEELGAAFKMDGSAVQWSGQCRNGQPGAILNLSSGTLLSQPVAPQPVVQFIRMMSPANDVQVPATRESNILSQILPVPKQQRPEGTAPRGNGLRLKNPE